MGAQPSGAWPQRKPCRHAATLPAGAWARFAGMPARQAAAGLEVAGLEASWTTQPGSVHQRARSRQSGPPPPGRPSCSSLDMAGGVQTHMALPVVDSLQATLDGKQRCQQATDPPSQRTRSSGLLCGSRHHTPRTDHPARGWSEESAQCPGDIEADSPARGPPALTSVAFVESAYAKGGCALALSALALAPRRSKCQAERPHLGVPTEALVGETVAVALPKMPGQFASAPRQSATAQRAQRGALRPQS